MATAEVTQSQIQRQLPNLEQLPLEKLFAKAMEYGRIYLHQFDDGRISFDIKFITSVGIHLKAQSGNQHLKIEPAIIAAIENAESIRRQFK